MKRALVLAVACVFAWAVAGCAGSGSATSGGGAQSQRPAAKAPAADVEVITTGVDNFFKAVATGNSAAITAMIVPSQATGFDAKKFIEDRMRMKPGSYEMLAWDLNSVGVTPIKGSPDMLSSCAVAVRILPLNEVRPVIVNLHWHKQSGQWWIVPYPEVK